MNKCLGCGITLQNKDEKALGYVRDLDKQICERCFRINSYNEHQKENITVDNEKILSKINEKNIFTFFLIDLFNINDYYLNLYQKITNNKLFVITKMDLIPKNISLATIANNLHKKGINDMCFFSIKNEFGKKEVLNEIQNHDKVIFVGPTSSGKSSLINFLFDQKITVSAYQNTTQDFIAFKYNNILVIDAPGFNYLSNKYAVNQSGYLKPKVIKLKKGYTLEINNFKLNALDDLNLTLFIYNKALVKTYKTKVPGQKHKIDEKNDLIIDNIGFIYFRKGANVEIITDGFMETRESIVSKNE